MLAAHSRPPVRDGDVSVPAAPTCACTSRRTESDRSGSRIAGRAATPPRIEADSDRRVDSVAVACACKSVDMRRCPAPCGVRRVRVCKGWGSIAAATVQSALGPRASSPATRPAPALVRPVAAACIQDESQSSANVAVGVCVCVWWWWWGGGGVRGVCVHAHPRTCCALRSSTRATLRSCAASAATVLSCAAAVSRSLSAAARAAAAACTCASSACSVLHDGRAPQPPDQPSYTCFSPAKSRTAAGHRWQRRRSVPAAPRLLQPRPPPAAM
jgi:hypothetical protein